MNRTSQKNLHISCVWGLLLTLAGCVTSPPSVNVPEHVRERIARKELRPYDQPDHAEALYRAKRLDGAGEIDPAERYETARASMRRMTRYSTALDKVVDERSMSGDSASRLATWTSLGPGNIGGRTRTFLIDPIDLRTFYAGGVSGGIWKSVDAGASWRPIGEAMENIAVNSLTFEPGNSSVLYAGTGEGYFREVVRGTALPLRGAGIFRTEDGGATWSHLASTKTPDFHWVNDLHVSVHDPGRIYAATRTGVWRSNDRGVSWDRVLDPATNGGCLDLVARPDSTSDFLFASCGTLGQARVFRASTAESGTTWIEVLAESGMGRTQLAIAPSSPSTIYALSASNVPGPNGQLEQGLLAVFRSDANGDRGSWSSQVRNDDPDKLATLLLTNPLAASYEECGVGKSVYVNMGWYANVIAVDPVDPERIWAAGVDLFRSDDGGRSWGLASYWWPEESTGSFVHADQHAIVFHPGFDGGENQILYVANDGGVFRTDNARASIGRGALTVCDPDSSSVRWSPLNHDFGITQFYHGAPFPDGLSYLAGAQDNGTVLGSDAAGPNGWRRIWGGDGGYVAIDPGNPQVIYVESQFANIRKSTDGGRTFSVATAGLSDSFLFIPPFLLDPNDAKRLWTGGRRLWRSDNGASSWLPASTVLPSGRVSALAVAPQMSDRVLAGTSDGSIHFTDAARSSGANTFWSSTRPRGGFVSSLMFHPVDPQIAWATYAGFGGAHVWSSNDGGRSWTSMDGAGEAALPDIPVHSLVVDPTRPTRLFIGTDLGVFVSLDGGMSWSVETSGFPNAVTESLAIGRGPEGVSLFAFTHGRGAWRVRLGEFTPRRRGIRR